MSSSKQNRFKGLMQVIRQESAPSLIQDKETEVPLPQRLTIITQQLKKAKVWDDPKKKQKLEKLLAELSSLMGE